MVEEREWWWCHAQGWMNKVHAVAEIRSYTPPSTWPRSVRHDRQLRVVVQSLAAQALTRALVRYVWGAVCVTAL